MNWKKLRSSTIVIGLFLILYCPVSATSRIFYDQASNTKDTVTRQSAETIIKIVLQHLPEYDPSFFDSYSAITYQQFRIKNSLSPKAEGLKIGTTESLTNQNKGIFIYSSETLTLQKLLKPGFSQSENLSTKTEGTDDGSFAELTSHLRNISLLKPIINLFNKNYLSPFSDATAGNYNFTSIDSVTTSGDTLCQINFQPKTGKFFDGFSGTAVIDTKKYVIQQISARSTQNDPQEPLLVINQNFEQVDSAWLPSKSKITVFYTSKSIDNKLKSSKEDNFIAESTNTIYQQQINPKLSPDDFKTSDQPSAISDTISNRSTGNYIYIPIDHRDSISQLQIDSAIIADAQNQQTKMIRRMAEGKISLGYFDLDYNKIFGYNLFEGVKIGLGGETNHLLSRHFTVGGFISYGFKDRAVRHGEWINIYPTGQSDLRIYLGYKDINLEFGGPEFLETKSLLNPESYRNLLIKNMYSTKQYATGLEFRPFNELDIYLFGDLSKNRARQNTDFLLLHPFDPISLTRTGLQLRYSPGIKREMEDGRLNEMKSPKADYYITFIQGLTILGGKYRYTKLEFKGKFDLPFKKIGTTTIMVRGGTITQNAPIIELFNGYGSFTGTFSLAAPYSFGTMQLNEFAASNYTAIHLRHNFSTWLFPVTYQKQPAFIFAQNIGFGKLSDKSLTQFNLQDYRKGFYESGFEVNNLLRMTFLSWGVGIYYRYGPYQFSSTSDNFAYKFGFFFKL